KQASDPAWGQYAQGLVESYDGGGMYDRPRNGRKNDKAHPPIHPTAHANDLSGDEKRVYEYVTRRFLGSCSKDALGFTTTVEMEVAEERFAASGLIIQERNYLDVFVYDKWKGTILPHFTANEVIMPTACNLHEGRTARPKMLNEADLVNLMDKNGIGTDATIAEHIAKVIDREYVFKLKQGSAEYLYPSTLGMGLVHGYNRIGHDKSLSKPLLRRETEYRMSLICSGQRTRRQTVEESLEEYREMFGRTKQEFATLAGSVEQFLRNPPDMNLDDDDDQERAAEDVDEPEAEPGAGGEEEVALRLDKDPLPQTRRGPHLRCVQEAQELERRREAAVPVRHPAQGRRARPAAAAVVRRVAKMSAITAETLGTGHRNARIADGQDCADQAVDSSSALQRSPVHTPCILALRTTSNRYQMACVWAEHIDFVGPVGPVGPVSASGRQDLEFSPNR
ncbi:unnamed protein product, partial [Tilletia laevis]